MSAEPAHPEQFGTDAPGAGRRALVTTLVIAAGTALVYSNSLDASFHLDDEPTIVLNERLRDLGSQWPPTSTRYLGYLSFALNYRVGGLEVPGYHLANLLIHLCNALLVAWLAATALRTPALRDAEAGPLVRRHLPLVAGLLFAVHPVATQAVTYVVQRFASLATLFYLLSLALYAQARLSLEAERPSKARAACLYSLSFVAAIGAMKTKEISFTLPFMAAAFELLFFRPGRRRPLLLVPLAATALLVPLGLAMTGQRLTSALHASPLSVRPQEVTGWTYLLTQPRVVVTYIRLLLLPIRQNLDYDFPISRSIADPELLLALALLLAVVAGSVLLLLRARTSNRAAGVLFFFGIAWFFVTLSVESSFIPIRDVIYEHRLYLPSAGATLALATALLALVERLELPAAPALQVAGVLAVTAAPLGAAAYLRNLVWKDELTLWSDVVAKSPGKSRPHTNLGNAYAAKARPDDAVREYREAIRLDPTDAIPHYDLGNAYHAAGRLDDAVREYREAIRLDPAAPDCHYNLGNAYRARGQLDEAAREYRETIRLDPGAADAHDNLGQVHEARGRLDEAIAEYREAIRLDPGLANPHRNLGNVYRARGELDAAAREYREATRLTSRR